MGLYTHESIWQSAPRRIGKHDWRVIIWESTHHGRCTSFEFRELPIVYSDGTQQQRMWFDEDWWPNYKRGDGLPRSLKGLYQKNRDEIEAVLAGTPAEAGMLF